MSAIDALRSLAASANTAPLAVVFAAFGSLIYRYTEEAVCSLGVGAGDVRRLQVDFADDPPFDELLPRANAVLCAAFGRAPLGTRTEPVTLTFGWLEGLTRDRAIDNVSLVAVDDGEQLRLRWTYDAQVFKPATIERRANHFAYLIGGLSAQPWAPISQLPLMDDAERRAVIELGRGSDSAYEQNATIQALFALQAHATPTAPAVADAGGTYSYLEIEERANALAQHLLSLGVGLGTAVGISLERTAALPVALLAILKAGAFYVPLDAAYPRERLEFIVNDAGIEFVVTAAARAGTFCIAGVTVVDLSQDAATIARQTGIPPAMGDADALAYVCYTSGSTGRPKGVAVRHRGVVRLVRNTDYINVRADDVFLQFAPVAFDASTFELWAPLLNGAQVAFPRPGLLSMPELGETIAAFGVTVLFLTTSLFGRLVDSHLSTLSSLRLLLTGGEVASPRHMCTFLETLPGCVLMAVYGPTENTTFSTWCELPDAVAIGQNVPIGRPIANSSAYVLDRHGRLAPIGAAGELWVGGDGVAAGYVNLSELTRERFVPDPFSPGPAARLYRTGDRARLRSDGRLEFLGRNDNQVKIRGHRIELGEVESVLKLHPAVLNAAVVVAHDGADKALVAFVVPATGVSVDERVLRAFLTSKLPAYMLPKRCEIVERLPQHSSGKLDRIALASLAEEPKHKPSPVRPQLSRNANLQQAIAAVWQEVLASDRIPGSDENFFDVGGDSLRLLTVHERLGREFGVKLSIVDLFEHSTVRQLAAFIERSVVRA